MAEGAIWDIDEMLEAYAEAPKEMRAGVETKFSTVFRFMNDHKLLTKKVVDSSGKLTARRLYRKDFTAEGMDFVETYESKWLKSKMSTDPEKGPKLLDKFLQELRGKRKRSG
jgi:hypothetical protein